jgi:uncharacterized protein with HEPN domain
MSIFGSVARGEPHPQDVDIAVRLGKGFSEGGSTTSTNWSSYSAASDACFAAKWMCSRNPRTSANCRTKSTGTAPLPSNKPGRRVRDIIENAEAIPGYTAGMNFAAFQANRQAYDATERCLLRISEAAVKLGDLAPMLMPNQPWDRIRAIGNYLRHQYDDMDQQQVWEIVQVHLRPLCADCKEALNRLPESPARD